ncbi:branched-chain amino acid ABC transporter permease [Chelatococcus sp. GCM10030263]|uniref:branched-chain amino acid ABC transporter permease n=1 Tax=Chelatococcus sp. GCM10030263 TaxID=3273387 RepID=UPI003611CE10
MRRTLILASIGLALLAAACARVDAEQERVCQDVIAPLNPDDAVRDIGSARPGPLPDSLRIDYTVADAAGRLRQRLVICRFAGSGLAAEKSLLIGIATESGPLPNANFYFLKRFYLDAAEAEKTGGTPIPADAPLVSAALGLGLQQAIAAVPLVAIYSLIAAAYALVFGLIGRINLAFGEFAVLGGVATAAGVGLALSGGASAPIIGIGVGLILALASSALHGLVLGRLTIAPIRGGSGQRVLIASVGLALALAEYLRLAQGSRPQWVPPVWNNPITIARAANFSVTVTPMTLGIAAVGLGTALLLVGVMRFSAFGRAWRAYADDPGAAALCGVDGGRLFDRTFLVACALAGLAGFIVTIRYGSVGYTMGLTLGLKALIAAVLGGIGSVGGAFLGGVIIGIGEAVWSATMPIENRDIAVYALLVTILIFKPDGLFGDDGGRPRGP